MRTPVVTCVYSAPVLEFAEYILDLVALAVEFGSWGMGEQPKIGFDKSTDISADDYFAGEVSMRGPDQDEREVAKEYLLEALAGGPMAAAELKSQCDAPAISASTLDRARKEIGIITAKQGKIWNSLPLE